MSVLETFYFAFKSDAKDVIKGTEDALKSSNKLDKSLLDNKQAADALSRSFLSAIQRAGQRISGILAVGSLASQTLRETGQAEELGRFTERLDQNIEEVSTWGKLIEQTGGSAEGFRSTLEGLTNTLTDFSITGGGAAAQTFARLEINAFKSNGQLKTALELLPEIADSFQNISREEAVNLGRSLGLDNATILLLQRGREEIEQLIRRQQRLGIVTREDTEVANAFNMAWRDTRTTFDSLVRRIGFSFLPALTGVQTNVQETLIFLRENGNQIADTFKAAGLLLTWTFLPAITAVGIKTAVALTPFVLIGGAIALAGLALNDLIGYLNGYDSIIGRLLDKNQDVKESFHDFVDAVQESIDYLRNDAFSDLRKAGVDSINQVRSIFGLDPIEGGTEQREPGPLLVTSGPTDAPVLTEAGIEALDTASQYNALATTGNPTLLQPHESQTNQTSNSISIQAINVDARGSNPEQMAQQAGGALRSEMETTIANMSTAIQG